jgi:hypothetical protein
MLNNIIQRDSPQSDEPPFIFQNGANKAAVRARYFLEPLTKRSVARLGACASKRDSSGLDGTSFS